jgi:L-iditol 2-dehydrogenase
MGYQWDGGLAEQLTLPELCLYPAPPGMSTDEAVLVKTLGVALHAVERIDLKPGDSVAVIGPGSVGLLAAQIADQAGATPVIVIGIERDAERLAFARQRGFHPLTGSPAAVAEAVRDLTGGFGVEHVVEASGGKGALNLAVELVARGGSVSVVGIGTPEPFDSGKLVSKEVTLAGAVSRAGSTWRRALNLAQSGKLDLAPFVTHRYPLSRGLEAIAGLRAGHGIKTVVYPDALFPQER